MVDFHCHILHQIDDGSTSLNMSIEMAKTAFQIGIRHIIATPHFNDTCPSNYFQQIHERRSELQEALFKNQLDITIHVAAEVAFLTDVELVLNTKELRWRDKFILFELPEHEIPYKMIEQFFNYRRKGIIPILAHPERNIPIQKTPQLLKTVLEMGVLLQCDAGSLQQHFGTQAKKCADYLLSENLYSIIGSDAHDIKMRNYQVLDGITDFLENHKLLTDEGFIERQMPEKNDENFFQKSKTRIFNFFN